MRIIDRLFHRKKASAVLELSRDAVEAFVELIDRLVDSHGPFGEITIPDVHSLIAIFERRETSLRKAAKSLRRCREDPFGFQQVLILSEEPPGESVSLLYPELNVLKDLSVSILVLRPKRDAAWQAHFQLISNLCGTTYFESTRERLKMLLGRPTPCARCREPLLPRSEDGGFRDLVRRPNANHLSLGLCRRCAAQQKS